MNNVKRFQFLFFIFYQCVPINVLNKTNATVYHNQVYEIYSNDIIMSYHLKKIKNLNIYILYKKVRKEINWLLIKKISVLTWLVIIHKVINI